jgi:pimeloyl-ACP methyl ester carboxylesterase
MLGEDASDDEVIRLREVLASVEPAVLAGRLREVLAVDASDALRACPAKLLYIGGRRDRLVPARALEHIQAVRPDVEVALLDAPHLVLQRRPVETADLVASFLRRRG